ncbi:DUF1501 domain-containing protein [Fibrella sp. WM1]|uniref:DUF1501 domain-containing protein n=1 Tax=Fibrella musci TaxID=3242485 RepID=UPI0035228809
MNRRKFLTTTTSLALPLALNGFRVNALARNSVLVRSLLGTNAVAADRALVIININGGNDGLNMVIPVDQYSAYSSLRSNIAIPQSSVLALAGNDATGLHPAMTGLRDLYNDGRLTILHSVGYPNPDQSHQRSADIWMTGVSSNQYAETGWAGRYLDDRFPGYPDNYPSATMEDPLALQIGFLTSTTLLGPIQSMGVAINDPNSFYTLVGSSTNAPPDYLPCCDAGDKIAHIRQQQTLAVGYAGQIKAAFDAGATRATYPTSNSLADQLKIVARLIHGGLKTKIYFVSISGFDTHSAQVDATDNTIGAHATLLGKVSAGIKAFQDDVALQGIADKVIGMTFSEFGRRANSNNSKGTDHGMAAPMFVFGQPVKHPTIGVNPDLSNLIVGNDGSRNIPYQIDFRRVYSDILNDWFGAGIAKTNALLFKTSPSILDFPTVSLFSNMVETVKTGNWADRTVWSVGRKPLPSEYVRVNAGHTLTVDAPFTVRNIRLDGKIRYTGPYTVRITG